MIAFLMLAAVQAETEPVMAASARAPVLSNANRIAVPADYPDRSMRNRESGLVSILLHVSPEGRVTSCEVTESSGFHALDTISCNVHRVRARFAPATDEAGTPVAGIYRTVMAWGFHKDQPRAGGTIPLYVSKLAASYKGPVQTELLFDRTGRVTTCSIKTTSGSGAADRAACAYLKQKFFIDPPKSGSNDIEPVAVRNISAALEVAGKP